MTTKAKNEISHEELDKHEKNGSGRYNELGSRQMTKVQVGPGPEDFKDVPSVLIDKVIFPSNKCPHCGSEITFHKRIQESGNVAGNVLRVAQSSGPKGYAYLKYDYCLDCHKEFIFEIYVWRFEEAISSVKE